MRRRFLVLAAACLGTAAAAAPLRFEQAFPTAGEPAALHYKVLFQAQHGVHRMEIWRDRDAHVKRATDAAILSYATHKQGDAGYTLNVLDQTRRISTRIDRTNMYRIGNFSDWFDLAHGLRHPKGAYRIVGGASPAGMPASAAPCRWYDLIEAQRTTHVCWDAKHGLPLLIAAAPGAPQWRVVAIDTAPLAPATFVINDKGYTHTDANADIERD